MASHASLLCALVVVVIVSYCEGAQYRIRRSSGSYSSSSSSASSSSGSIYFGDPGQAFSGSSSSGYASGPQGSYATGPHTAYSGYNQGEPDLLTRSGIIDSGTGGGSKGVFSSSSSKIDSDGKIHYSVQAGRF